jgi:hypothetical protein
MSNGDIESDDIDDSDSNNRTTRCSAQVKLSWAPATNVTGTTRKNQKASLKSVDVPVMFRKAKGKAPVFTAKVVGIIESDDGSLIEVPVSEYSLFMNGTTGRLELKSFDKDENVSHVPPKFVAELIARPGQNLADSNSDENEDDYDDDDELDDDELDDEEDDD